MRKKSQQNNNQLQLWEDQQSRPSLREALSEVKWSYSKRSTFEQCPRKYYYDYFGTHVTTAIDEPDKDKLRFLKDVQNRYLRTGEILHVAIRTYFKKARQGQFWTPNRLTNFALDIFDRDLLYSQRYPKNDPIADTDFPPVLLMEYYYEWPDAEEVCLEAKTRLYEALNAFMTESTFEEFRSVGANSTCLVEHKFRLANFPLHAGGQIDLAYQRDGNVTIVDWKIGVADGSGDDSLQLAAYALWAIDHFRCSPEHVRICKVHLSSKEIVDFRIASDSLTSARIRIIQDATRLLDWQQYGDNARSSAFTPCLKPLVCKLCPFREVCYARN